MDKTVFYSWQSDREPKSTRYLVRDALSDALAAIGGGYTLDEATRGTPGTPDIVGTLFGKIERSLVFVPDLTLVGDYGEGTLTPNPNVLVENGFALHALGSERIIPVLNSHYGLADQLPFDLRGRAVRVQYRLGSESTKDERGQVQKQLAGMLGSEIRLVIDQAIFGGLSAGARTIIETLIKTSATGDSDSIDYEAFCHLVGLEDAAARRGVDELESAGLVSRASAMGKRIVNVRPTAALFWKFDRVFMGWDTEGDAMTLAKMLVGDGSEGHQLAPERTARALGWSVRRINPAVTYLRDNQYVEASRTNSYPIAAAWLLETARTRALVRGDLDD